MKRKEYTREFKIEICNLLEDTNISAASRELGIERNILFRWKNEYRKAKEEGKEAFPGQGNRPREAEQCKSDNSSYYSHQGLVSLKQQLATALKQVEVLKKTVAVLIEG